MPAAPRVLFLCSCPPGPGVGSPVIIDRHLRRMSDAGWDVSSACLQGSTAGIPISRPHWNVVELPWRRPWWPPYREGSALLFRLRARLWWREIVRAHPPGTRFDAIFTLFGGDLASFGADFARRARASLHVFVHDLFEPRGPHRAHHLARDRTLIAGAAHVWHVSQQMLEKFRAIAPDHSGQVLPPISENALAPDAPPPVFRRPPHVVFAGMLHDSALAIATGVARELLPHQGRLTVVGRHSPAAAADLARLPNVTVRGYFPSNRDAVDFVARHATSALVCYGFDQPDAAWLHTCFPSKLLEFAARGIPPLVVAPADTPVVAWARRRGLAALATDLGPGLAAAVRAVADPASWARDAALTRTAALGEFHPDALHAVLAATLPAPRGHSATDATFASAAAPARS